MNGHPNCRAFCVFAITEKIFPLLLALSVTGCTQSWRESGRATEVEAIRALDESWVAAGQSKSVDTWVAFYADDAAVLPPNEPIATSRGAIRKSVSELLTLPGLSVDWKPTQIEVARSGKLAYLYGAYRLEWDDSEKRATESGKNVEIWKKQSDGRWKCIVDAWNSDLPTTPAPIK
jgi:uncharacterized protein (TIGR02246 family)